MANKLYITATEKRSGKSAVTLGMMQLLMRHIRSVAFFRPIIANIDPNKKDHDINLILTTFNIAMPYEDTYACSFKEARTLIAEQKSPVLIEKIIQKYKHLEDNYDFILCEGTDYLSNDSAFEFELNIDIAANLNMPLAVIVNGKNKSIEDLISSTVTSSELIFDKGQDIACLFINKTTLAIPELENCKKAISTAIGSQVPIAMFPNNSALRRPTVSDIKRWMKAEVIYGEECLNNSVEDYIITTMQPNNFLDQLQQGLLIITSADRSDIVLASLASRLSMTYPDIAGIILTGKFELSSHITRLINGWQSVPVPILTVSQNSYQAIMTLSELYGKINVSDTRKIHIALAIFEQHADSNAITQRVIERTSDKVSPKMFEFKLIEQARRHKMRIVLPEGTEDRILKAAEVLSQREVADITLLGDIPTIHKKISDLGLSLHNVQLIQPNQNHALFENYVQTYYELRKHKGITLDDARDWMNDTTYFGTMMVYKNDVDGMVSGATNTTAHTVRPAFEIIKTKPGASIVSSVFLMCMKDRILVFGDCAVNPNPTAEQLADIAISSAQTAHVFGIPVRVAMLSYSTGTSGKGIDVDIVSEATKIAHEKAPHLILDGPIQYDAAIDPDVAKTKAPTSVVAGKATVFIFPDLNTGNNTYKAVQRAAGAIAIGPILQGLKKPVNDLSRGCTVTDIINTVTITAIQAQAEQGLITID